MIPINYIKKLIAKKDPVRKEHLEVAVEWWANQLRNPTFKTLSVEERQRRETYPTALAEVMAYQLRSTLQIPEEEIEAFKKSLYGILEKNENLVLNGMFHLSVGYSPDRYLSLALEEAGLKNKIDLLSSKTGMHFDRDGSISVKVGYGFPYKKIYQPTK